MADSGIEGVFNFGRLLLLLKRDLVNGYRGLLIAMGAVGAVVLVSSVLSMFAPAAPGFYFPGFALLLFLGGFIYTAGSFRELADPVGGQFYLTLPGSVLEKLLSKLLVSSLGYAVASLFFYAVVAAFSELVNLALFGAGHGFFDPLAPTVLQFVLLYLVLQSVFLLGSIWFRKLAFLKTALAAAVLVIGLLAFAGAVFCTIFGLWGSQSPQPIGRFFAVHKDQLIALACVIQPVLFWGCLAPLCWVITFLRLREAEA